MTASPHTEPSTMPAIALEEMLSGFVVAVDEVTGEELTLVVFKLAEEVNSAHPSFGALGAKPSMGCAYACATEVVATKGARFVEPLSSYLSTVTVDDTVKSL